MLFLILLDINALYNLTGKCMLEDQRIPKGGKGGVFGGCSVGWEFDRQRVYWRIMSCAVIINIFQIE